MTLRTVLRLFGVLFIGFAVLGPFVGGAVALVFDRVVLALTLAAVLRDLKLM